MTNERNGMPWPKIYSTTTQDRLLMTPEERTALWAEYREFWRGYEGHSNPTLQDECQKDWQEEREGTTR